MCARMDSDHRPPPCRGGALAAGRRARLTKVRLYPTLSYMNDYEKTAFLHAFHRFWTRTTGPGYDKGPWRELHLLAERLPADPELRRYLLRVAEALSVSQMAWM